MIKNVYWNFVINKETGKTEKHGESVYEVEKDINKDYLIFRRNNLAKQIRVRPDKDGYVYSIKKTFISADGGRDGLYDFLAKEENKYGFFHAVCNKVFDYMK